MEFLNESQSLLKISWSYNHSHIKDREYVSGCRGWFGPGVTYEQALANEQAWKALSAEDKIARENTFAFTFESVSDSLDIDLLEQHLRAWSVDDPTACVKIVEPMYRYVKNVKEEYISHLAKATSMYDLKLERYNKLVDKFVRSLKGYDLYDGTDVVEFDFSAPELETSKEWYHTVTEMTSPKEVLLIFRRDSPTFEAFEKHGWIKRYAPWH